MISRLFRLGKGFTLGFVDSGGITDHHRCINYLEFTQERTFKSKVFSGVHFIEGYIKYEFFSECNVQYLNEYNLLRSFIFLNESLKMFYATNVFI